MVGLTETTRKKRLFKLLQTAFILADKSLTDSESKSLREMTWKQLFDYAIKLTNKDENFWRQIQPRVRKRFKKDLIEFLNQC